MARARATGSANSVTMIATITDDETAPPIPCTKRAAMRSAWSWASAQIAEEAVNSRTPPRNTRLRPTRSPRRPASRRKLPNVIRYALTTHVRLAWLNWRSLWIEGSATLTIVASRAFMSWARQTTTSAAQRRRSRDGGAAAVGGKGEAMDHHYTRDDP